MALISHIFFIKNSSSNTIMQSALLLKNGESMLDKRGLNRAFVVPIANCVKNQDESKRRSPDDIKAEFLIAASNGIQKTATMSRCNLSFSQAKKYARILCDCGLLSVTEADGKKLFVMTEKGKRWLEQFRKLKEIENGADLSNISYIA